MRVLKSPWLLIAAQAIVLAAALGATGRMRPTETDDTGSYQARHLSLADWLGHFRTPGYPLLLRAAAAISPNHRLLPWLQLSMHLAAVLVLYWGLRQVGMDRWVAAAAGSAVFWSNLNLTKAALLMTDAPASSAAVAAVGLAMTLGVRRASVGVWIGLTATVLLAWQLRPANLVLVPLVPAIAVATALLRPRESPLRLPWMRLLGSALAVGSPVVAWCTLRWVVVGQFSPLPFSGVVLIGITGQVLEPSTVSTLAPQDRPLAEAMLRDRSRVIPGFRNPADGKLDYERARNQLIATQWHLAYPAAANLYGQDHVTIDRRLTSISDSVFASRPTLRFQWFAFAFREGLGMILSRGLAWVALCAVWLAWWMIRSIRRRATDRSAHADLPLLTAVAGGFALANLVAIAWSTFPLDRYMDAAAVLLPMIPAAGLASMMIEGRRPTPQGPATP